MSWPRPFVVGFILLMVFLSMSGDGPSNLTTTELTDSSTTDNKVAAENDKDLSTKGVKEQIIYDLSISNEKLEQEIKQFRQYTLDFRRAVRSQPGCSFDDSSILTLYPELHVDIDTNDDKDNDFIEENRDSGPKPGKEAVAAGTVVVAADKKEEQQQQQDAGSNSNRSTQVDYASVRLQNGRLSKDNSTAKG